MTSITAQALDKLVSYNSKDPRGYNEKKQGNAANQPNNQNENPKTKSAFNEFKDILNAHLQGERGKSTIKLLWQDPTGFNSQEVKLGLTASCPMSLRLQIVAQHNYRAKENRVNNKLNPPNNEDIRITNLMAATLGFVFSLAYKIIRVVLRTLFAPITALHSLYQQNRYGVEGWAKEDLKRVGWEWVDAGACVVSFVAIINTVHPNAIKLDSLRNYYIKRHDEAIAMNQKFAEQKKKYFIDQQEIRREMEAGN